MANYKISSLAVFWEISLSGLVNRGILKIWKICIDVFLSLPGLKNSSAISITRAQISRVFSREKSN
jgi:hypothetical protein